MSIRLASDWKNWPLTTKHTPFKLLSMYKSAFLLQPGDSTNNMPETAAETCTNRSTRNTAAAQPSSTATTTIHKADTHNTPYDTGSVAVDRNNFSTCKKQEAKQQGQ